MMHFILDEIGDGNDLFDFKLIFDESCAVNLFLLGMFFNIAGEDIDKFRVAWFFVYLTTSHFE